METKTTKRKPTSQRREEIVEAVFRIIGDRGLTNLTTKTLAAEVGVTAGAIFRHFDNLDDVLREVTRVAIERIEATYPSDDEPAAERLFALGWARVQLLGQNRGLAWLLRSEQAFLTLPEDAVEELTKAVRRSKRFLMKAIRDGISEGSIRGDLAPESMLTIFVGTVHSLISSVGGVGIHQRKRANQKQVLASFEALKTILLAP